MPYNNCNDALVDCENLYRHLFTEYVDEGDPRRNQGSDSEKVYTVAAKRMQATGFVAAKMRKKADELIQGETERKVGASFA
jgi:hypothetical protein